MGRSKALYREIAVPTEPRAGLALEQDVLEVSYPDGRFRRMPLDGCRVAVSDASCRNRFVRHLALIAREERVDLITPPDEGTIAPRAARLPTAPAEAVVVAATAWEIVVDWVQSSGRMAGRTVAELARLTCVASPQFAVVLGELAAQVAVEMVWERMGPMRGGGEIGDTLRPLEEAARTSPRAGDALIAALAASALLRRRRRLQ
jgi:hypothetical protein